MKVTSIVSQLKRLHKDERGAEGLEKLLIIAAIVLPLLGVLIFFRGEIMTWVKGVWDTAKGSAEKVDPANPY
jgi:Flp pilus assembly pilin Flp